MPAFEQLIASVAVARDLLCCDREPLDVATRQLAAAAAKLLRSTSPNDGQIEILLHEMARTLEKVSSLAPKREPEHTGKAAAAPEWRTRVAVAPRAHSGPRSAVSPFSCWAHHTE